MTLAKFLFWVVIVTTTKIDISEVKLKCLTHHFRTKYIFIPRSAGYDINSTSFMLKKSTQVSFLNHDLFLCPNLVRPNMRSGKVQLNASLII
jgi:hypothetical protein